MKKEVASFIKLVVALLLLLYVGQWLLFSNLSNFVLHSSYANFRQWYPSYYIVLYVILCVIRLVLFGVSIYIAKLLIEYAKDSYRLSAFYITDTRKAFAQVSLTGLELKHTKAFVIAQLIWLAMVLALYYLLPYWGSSVTCSRMYLVVAIGMGFVFAIANRLYVAQGLNFFLFQPTSAYNLGIYRIGFFMFLLYRYAYSLRNFLPYIETKERVALPYIGWLVHSIPISSQLYCIAVIIGIIACIFLILGLFTRIALFVNAILVFYILAVPNFYGKLWHGQMPIWISWFLLFADVNGRFALDNLLFPKTKVNYLSSNHTFALRIIWLQIGVVYFWAGFHKLWQSGFGWALGPSMINQLRLEWFEHYDTYPFFRVDKYPTLLHIGGLTAIFFEILFLFFLFSRHWKYISIVGGLVMHNVIGIFMYISFSSLQLQYLAFINYEKAVQWLKQNILRQSITNVPIYEASTGINKPLVYFSVGILAINFLFGLGNVSSYPFSVYPTYTEIVGSEKEYLHYEPVDAEKKELNIRKVAQQARFRWEHFSRLDYGIIDQYEKTGTIDTVSIQESWKWWALKIDTLKTIDTLDVSIVRRSLNPDSVDIVISKRHLIRLYPNEKL